MGKREELRHPGKIFPDVKVTGTDKGKSFGVPDGRVSKGRQERASRRYIQKKNGAIELVFVKE